GRPQANANHHCLSHRHLRSIGSNAEILRGAKMPRMELIFYYDVVCPYAYLASTRIEALARRVNVPLRWKPILLGGVFKAIGRDETPLPAPKARLNLLDIRRQAEDLGVPLEMPADHPRRTVAAMRLLHCVDGEARVRLTHALYRAYWVEGR